MLKRYERCKKAAATALSAAMICGASSIGGAQSVAPSDDTSLFSTAVAPNVLLMVDNSGSMNHVVWHPEFKPTETPTCTWRSNTGTYYYSSSTTSTHCGNTRKIFVDSDVSPGHSTRWDGRYMNWYFSDAADDYYDEIIKDDNGSRSDCLVSEGFSATYSLYKRARISAAKDILHDVICRSNQAGDVRFGLSQYYSSSDPQGGYVRVAIDDYTGSHGNNLRNRIEAIDANSWTPLGENLYKIYPYFMSRGSDRPTGKDTSTKFPVYNITSSGGTTSTPSNYLPDVMKDASTGELLSCRKNFIVLITDGEPTKDDFDSMSHSTFRDDMIGDYNPDNSFPENGSEDPAVHNNDIANDYETALYLDDIAYFMNQNDFRPDIDGDQLIDIYTVGFTTSPYANAVLRKTAAAGNGEFFYSNNAEELTEAITNAITDIIAKSQSFTAVTVPANRTSSSTALYATYFVPKRESFWDGHLKQFEFNAAGEIRDAQTPSHCALDDPDSQNPVSGTCQTGPLRLTSLGYWDAAEEIPVPNLRKLYTSYKGYTRQAGGTITKPLEFDTADLDAADLGVDDSMISLYADVDQGTANVNDDDDLAEQIIAYGRGCDFGSAPCDPRGSDATPRLLADIFHSNPVVVGAPNSTLNNDSYRVFAHNYRHRSKVIYAGSNGGFMHAFHTGAWHPEKTSPEYVPSGWDRGTGEELFGFMAYPARENAWRMPIQKGGKVYYMDGSPQVADIWLYPEATYEPSYAADWRTVMVGGMREGGRAIWALDITNPDNVAFGPKYPGYLWEFPCEHTECASYDEAKWMGETWSEPIFTRVRVKVGGDDNDGKGFIRSVVIFGAGYDVCGDPHSLEYDDAVICPSDAVGGRAIFMVDVTTGEVLAAKRFANTGSGPETEMKYAIASAPAVFDFDFDGFGDVVYVGDLGGNLWKWVIEDIVEDPINGSGTTDPSAWTFVRLFSGVTCNTPTCIQTRHKSFFSPPTGAMLHGKLILALGSGERKQLEYEGDSSTDLENNRFYVLRDDNPTEFGTEELSSAARFTDASGEDFQDLTSVSAAGACVFPDAPSVGYFLEVADGEKFVTNPLIFLGSVLTGTYLPTAPTSPCDTGGEGYLLGFELLCGKGTVPDPDSDDDGATQRRVKVGQGLPTKTKVSVGALSDQSGGDGGCPNKAISLSSDGTVFGFNEDCLPSTGVRVKSWREE